MWHLLLKDRIIKNIGKNIGDYYRQHTAFVRIILLCALLHSIVFFFSCFVRRDDTLHIALNVPHNMRIVCVPSFLATTATIAAQKTPQREIKKIAPAKKQSAPAQQKPPKKLKKKTALIEKAVVKTKQKKQEIKKEIIPPKASAEKNISPKTSEKKSEKPVQEEVLYVNQETFKTIEIAQQLQKAIGAHWNPPLGMPAGLSCDVRLVLDAQGKVTALEVVKKSGVAVFDMAARTALLAAHYPAVVKGKSLVVHFTDAFFQDGA